jgi:hypothetical protein
MQSPIRFSSCRGVAFESKLPHADPSAIKMPTGDESPASRSIFSLGSSKDYPFSIQRSISKTSSHFCDLDLDHEDHDLEVALEGNDEEKQRKPALPLLAAQKKDSRLSIVLLDQGLLTVYKRLFAVCLILNITGLLLAATGHFPYARSRAALFSIANILALTLCRSEACLRVVFFLAVKILGRPWIPLALKTATTSLLQSLGGIHSGCGVSSIAWLIYALVLTLKDRETTSPEIIALASIILGLLCLSSLAAFPLVRHLHHNVFERTHRFAGWSALGLLWAFVILTISYDPETKSYKDDFGSRSIVQQEFWFTVAITMLIILPWLTVRRTAVKVLLNHHLFQKSNFLRRD